MSSNENDNEAEREYTPTMPHSAPTEAPRAPHLVVLSGPRVGSAYRSTKSVMIVGRDPDADIFLPHPTVSRRHARLRIEGDQVLVEDLDSANGTYLGLDRVRSEPRVVKDGDDLAFGVFILLKLTRLRPRVATRMPPDEQSGEAPSAGATARNYLLDVLRGEYGYARRHRTPLTLVFFRADAVATVPEGDDAAAQADELVSSLVDTISIARRTEDFVARVAEDEIVVLVRDDHRGAAVMAERVRVRVEGQSGFPERSFTWQTVTAATVQIEPRRSEPPGKPEKPAEDILAAARAVAHSAMRGTSNRVVRVRTLVI